MFENYWRVADKPNFYKVDGAEKDLLAPEAQRFEALSVGGGVNNVQIAIVPLDSSSRENAELIAKAPLMKSILDDLARVNGGIDSIDDETLRSLVSDARKLLGYGPIRVNN